MEEYRGDLIKSIWFIKTLPFFLIGFTFFLAQTYFSQNFDTENILSLLIFLSLIIGIVLSRKNFRLIFGDNSLHIKQLGKDLSISYDKVLKIFIRQSPIDKFLRIKSIIVQFNIPSEQEKVQIKAFGKSITSVLGLELPGTYGDLLTIPGLSLTRADELKDKFLKYSKKTTSDVVRMGVGYPYYNSLFRAKYFFGIFLVSIAAFILIINAFLYLYLLFKMR